MDPDRFNFVKKLLIELEDVPQEERQAYLERACGGDEALKAEVESLLHEGPATIMLTGGLGARIGNVLSSSIQGFPIALEQIGPYRLIEILGEGGMGVVYRAEQTAPIRREVALKLIRFGMDSGRIVSRFESERQTLAMMEHPNIARVFDAGTTPDGRPYFVMELVRGEPVTDFCARERTPLLDRLRLFLQICDGVRHAHQKGVIHRDIKPSNVLVTRSGDGVVPKIIDFGIAKAVADNAIPGSTMEGQVVGTPEYMSPEQAGVVDTGVDARTDVYSLGVLLYEMVSGKRPYDLKSRTPADIDRALRTPPKPPTAIGASGGWFGIPSGRHARDIDAVALMAIERNPEDRYDSIEQLADDVRRAIEHRPVRARTQTWTYRGRRFVRRNALAVATGAAFAALVASSAVAVVLQRNQALASEAQAVAEARRAHAEATKATEVSRFLVELFRESDPARTRGANVTARELLERGATRIRTELSGQDEVRATVMDTIGVVYRLLGLYQESEALLTEALDIRRRTLGPRHADVAATLDNLGQVARERNQYETSASQHREALAMRRELLGPRDPQLAQSLNNLALTLREWGKYDEAEPLAREALEIRLANYGPDHPEVLTSMNNLADLVWSRGNQAEAEKLHRAVLAARRRVLPAGHPRIGNSLHNVAQLVAHSGRLAEAEPLFREALEINRKAYGLNHPDTSTVLNSLGNLMHDLGRLEEAEPFYREALGIDQRLHGDKHMDVAIDMNNLASLLEDTGRLTEAGRMFEQSLAIRREVMGPNHPSLATLLNNLGRLRFAERRLADAERALTQAVEIRRAAGSTNIARHATTLTWLGRVRQRAGDLPGAERRFTEALELARRVAPNGGPETAMTLISLGRLLVRKGQSARAEPLLAEARDWRRQSLPAGHRGTGEAELALGECLLALSRFPDAEPLLLAGLQTTPVPLRSAHFNRRAALELLVTLYERWGKPEEARKYRAQLAAS
jgi:tetratricopeptide (TPR) repeat protein